MNRSSTRKSSQRRSARKLALITIPLALTLAACGGSGDTNGQDTGGLKGDPVKIMTIAPVETTGVAFPIFFDVAKVTQKYINANGGIGGRPIQIITCDDQGVPTKGADCARKAVQEKVIAVVGGFNFQGDSIVPILESADIAWFGDIVPITQLEYTRPNVQILGAGLADYVANGVAPGVDGCKKTSLLTYEGNGKTVEGLTNQGLTSVDAPPLLRSVFIPPDVQDLAPQVEQAMSGADCIVVTVAQVTFPPFFTAFKSAGGKQRLYVQAGNLFDDMLTDFVPQVEGMNIAGSYGNITQDAWADYREALTKYKAPGEVADYNGSASLGAWASYAAFKQVAEGIDGDLTSATFLKAAQKATIDLPGKLAPVDLGNLLTEDPDHLNSTNNNVSFETVKDGKIVPMFPGKFFDMTEAVIGKPLSAENRPPAVP